MVPSGSVLTYQAKGTTKYFQSPDDVVQEINVQLAQSNVTVRDFHTAILGVVGSVDAYLGAPASFQITAALQTSADFGATDDVRGIVDHAIYIATDSMPVSTIPSVTIPGSATATATGAPAQVEAASVPGTASNWFSSIFQSGVNSFALLMVGVILAVVLIVAGKHKGVV